MQMRFMLPHHTARKELEEEMSKTCHMRKLFLVVNCNFCVHSDRPRHEEEACEAFMKCGIFNDIGEASFVYASRNELFVFDYAWNFIRSS